MSYNYPTTVIDDFFETPTLVRDWALKLNYLPAAVQDQIKIKPIYETFPGWKVSTSGVKNMDSLPENAKKYIYALEDFIGAKVLSVSTSPEREDTILVETPFDI